MIGLLNSLYHRSVPHKPLAPKPSKNTAVQNETNNESSSITNQQPSQLPNYPCLYPRCEFTTQHYHLLEQHYKEDHPYPPYGNKSLRLAGIQIIEWHNEDFVF